MKAWTDYPILALGDKAGVIAPIRECEVLDYDRNKYCHIMVKGVREHVKCCYLYSKAGRVGEVPTLTIHTLNKLPQPNYN